MLKPTRSDFIDMTGTKIGMLVVVDYAGRDSTTQKCASLWKCRCICGNEVITRRSSLISGKTTSCGCVQKEKVTKHGMLGTGTYRSWNSMKQRCINPKAPNYFRYGGAGITVCERWMIFENFLADMGERPIDKTLDRFPNQNGNYEPGNCRWATIKEQTRNQSNNVLIEINGEKMTISAAAELHSIKPNQVYDRLRLGWDIMKALKTPLRRKKS